MPSTTTLRCSYFCPFSTFLQSKKEKKKVCLFKAKGQIPSGLISPGVFPIDYKREVKKTPEIFFVFILNVLLLIRS